MSLVLQNAKDHNNLNTPDETSLLLSYQGDRMSQRLQTILSQSRSRNERQRGLWDEYIIHYRSADHYVTQYIDCLKRIHQGRSRHVYEVSDLDSAASMIEVNAGEQDREPTRTEWLLEISRDSLVRDLLAMNATLTVLRTEDDASPNSGHIAGGCGSVIGSVVGMALLVHDPFRVEWYALTFGSLAAAVRYCPSVIRNYSRYMFISQCLKDIGDMIRRLKRNEVGEDDKGFLEGESFLAVDSYVL